MKEPAHQRSGLLERFTDIAAAVLAEEDASGEIVSYQEVVERLIDGIVAYSLERRGTCEVVARDARHVGGAAGDPLLAGGLTELLGRVIREGAAPTPTRVRDGGQVHGTACP